MTLIIGILLVIINKSSSLYYTKTVFMANQNNRALGENRPGKSKALSAGFLDLFIGSADFSSICKTMRIIDQPIKAKNLKK